MTESRRQPKAIPEGALVLSPAQVQTLTGRPQEAITAALRNKDLRGFQRVEGGRWSIHREDAIAWALGEAEEMRTLEVSR